MTIKAILIAYKGNGAVDSVKVYSNGAWRSADRGFHPEQMDLEKARELKNAYLVDQLPTDYFLQVICLD